MAEQAIKNVFTAAGSSGGRGTNVVLADMDHQNFRQTLSWLNTNFEDTIAATGKTDLALELPSELQGEFDDFAAGRITARQFRQALREETEGMSFVYPAVGELVRLAEQARAAQPPIRIHICDTGAEAFNTAFFEPHNDAIEPYIQQAREAAARRMPNPSTQAVASEFERIFLRLPRDERENLQSAIDERLAPILSQRLGNDQDFVDYLRERGVDLGSGLIN